MKFLMWITSVLALLSGFIFGGWLTGILSGLNAADLGRREVMLGVGFGLSVFANFVYSFNRSK